MQECKITFGRVIKSGRQYREFSQRELCWFIAYEYGCLLSHYELSKIENDGVPPRKLRLEIRSMAFRPASYEYNWLIPIIAEIFNVNVEWLEQIRQQTEPQPLDLSQGMFPIYFKP